MGKILKKIDEFDNIHYVDQDHELGRGGQGVVYKTKNADTVIKIALKNEKPINDEKEIKYFHQKIKKLIFKPLPSDINISKPLVVLKNEAGYIMNLLDGMYPFAGLIPKALSKDQGAKLEIPEIFKGLDNRTAIYFTHYLKTGSLRKKLYSLSRLAIILNRLHSRGIVYCDISHNNIFINNDNIPLVYLIDADNIEYETSNKESIITPDFEVPEVVNGKPNTTYSDIFVFGILSYLTLTTTHPFDGIGLEEAERWDSNESEKKEKWELPWIEDYNDDSNKCPPGKGLRGKLTITHELNILFHKLFEDGKNDIYLRPTLPLWIESLEKSACKTVECSCGMSYYYDLFDSCPYCKSTKPKRLVVRSFYYKDNKKLKERWLFVKEISDDTKKIDVPHYIFNSLDVLKVDDVFLEIKFSNKTRLELSFNKGEEKIYFESETPMSTLVKRIGISRFEKGISIITEGDITTLVEVKIEL